MHTINACTQSSGRWASSQAWALQVQAPITALRLPIPFHSAQLSQPEWKKGPEGESTRVGRTKPAQMSLV